MDGAHETLLQSAEDCEPVSMTTTLFECLNTGLGAPLGGPVLKLGHIEPRSTESIQELFASGHTEQPPPSNPALAGAPGCLAFARAARGAILFRNCCVLRP